MRSDHHDSQREDRKVRVTLYFDRDGLELAHTPSGVVVKLDGLTSGGEPGGPALPSTRVRIAVPEPFWPEKLSIDTEEWETVTDEPVLVVPAQLLRPGATRRRKEAEPAPDPDGAEKPTDGQHDHDHDCSGHGHGECRCSCCTPTRQPAPPVSEGLPAPEFTPPDVDLYAARAKNPPPAATAVEIETAARTHIAVVEVNPVRLGRKGQLQLCTRLELSIAYSDSMPLGDKETALHDLQEHLGIEIDPSRLVPRPEPVVSSLAEAERLRDITVSHVLNPDVVARIDRQWPFFDLPADYLIVTDDHAWNATSITPGAARPGMVASFARLAAWKRSRGVSAKVVTITDIVAGRYGDFRTGARDLQEVIRRFLKQAKGRWGVSWLLLGGDVGIVPVRQVAGAFEGGIDVGTKSTPDDNTSFWTGSFLKMHVVSPGTGWAASIMNQLIRYDTGQLIPYDSTGASGSTSPGWYFTTDNTYTTRTASVTDFVRVNGPAGLVNGMLQFIYQWNSIPTDFYYASLESWVWRTRTIDLLFFSFEVPYVYVPQHDWDALDNGLYGQHSKSGEDRDGVVLKTDLSVGRAPVDSATDANTFVDKVIGYERFGGGVYIPADGDWPRRMLLASSDWDGPFWFWPTANALPGDGEYLHDAAHTRSLLKLAAAKKTWEYDLVAEISPTDRRTLPYKNDPNPAVRGWYYATSATDMTVNFMHIILPWLTIDIPLPSPWIVVHGPLAERTPADFQLDWQGQDGSMSDQEKLRTQVRSELPGIDQFNRLYEDDLDLGFFQRLAAPIQQLTSDRLRDALNAGPHFVSLSGHGSSDGCCGGSVGLASGLTNGEPGFIGYADSCLTNQFDAADAFSEALLTNDSGGAVAYIGNTRFSWIGVGDDFQRAFFHRLTATRHLGLLNDSRCSVVGSTGARQGYDHWAVFALNLLGDPEMRVYRQAVPGLRIRLRNPRLERPIEIYVELAKPPRPPRPGPDPAPDVLVDVRQGDWSIQLRTDASGIARLEPGLLRPGPVEVTVSHEDYAADQVVIDIAEPQWLTGTVVQLSHRHDGRADSLVRLQTSESERELVASASHPDYRLILDAVENALIGDREISLLVESDDEGETISRFRLDQ